METNQARVLQYLESKPGLSLLIQDIASELDLPQDSTGTVLSKLHKNAENTGVIRVGRGLYRYVGTESVKRNNPSRSLFEQIGKTKGGRLLLQAEDEQLYLATPLEQVLD